MTRDPENDRYALERDLKTKLRSVFRTSRQEAVNPRRRMKRKPKRDQGEVPYQKTRRDQRRRREGVKV